MHTKFPEVHGPAIIIIIVINELIYYYYFVWFLTQGFSV